MQLQLIATSHVEVPVVAAIVLLAERLGEAAVREWQEVVTNFATFSNELALLAVGTEQGLCAVDALMERGTDRWEVLGTEAAAVRGGQASPMSAAPFVYRDDGRPDWAAMWTGFCDLALYGGPPHRGESETLSAPLDVAPFEGSPGLIGEIRRGIFETTGLFSEPAEPGWMAVTCHSRKMAAWLAATIILENVEARCDGEILYVPASPDFDLKNEVKSVITVVAKVNHYWQAHIEGQQPD
ncbi:MAG: hypothetical protein AB7N24_13395 [Dehalococcoidia bacterium]